MIDACVTKQFICVPNNGCVTKSKLATTVKTLSKYSNRSRVASKQTNKQTQRHRNWKTFRYKTY